MEAIHLLTKKTKYELRVDMEDFKGNKAFAKYSSISIRNELDGYRLTVSGFHNGGTGKYIYQPKPKHNLYGHHVNPRLNLT